MDKMLWQQKKLSQISWILQEKLSQVPWILQEKLRQSSQVLQENLSQSSQIVQEKLCQSFWVLQEKLSDIILLHDELFKHVSLSLLICSLFHLVYSPTFFRCIYKPIFEQHSISHPQVFSENICHHLIYKFKKIGI